MDNQNLQVNETIIDPELQHVYDREQGENFCYQYAYEIVSLAQDLLVDRHFETFCVPYCVNQVAEEMLSVIDYLFIKRDIGEPDIDNDPSWHLDTEPEPNPTDTFSRGSIPVRVKPPPRSISKVSSVSRASKSKMRRSKDFNRTDKEDKKDDNKPMQEVKKKPQIVQIQRSETKKKLEKKKDPQKELIEQRAAQIEEERQKYEKIKTQMRGKDYTFDNNGELILIQRVDPKRLPSKQVSMKVNIADEKPKTEEHDTSTRKQIHGRFMMTKQKNYAPKKKSKKEEFIIETTMANPMVEGVQPADGVVLREGKTVLKGEPLKKDKELILTRRRVIIRRDESEDESEESIEEVKEEKPTTPKSRPTSRSEKLAAAKLKQEKMRVSSSRAGDLIDEKPESPEKQRPGTTESDDTKPLPPQQPAIVPKVRKTVGMRGKLRTVFKQSYLGHLNRPKQNGRKPRLPPPIYPASYGHGFVTTYLGTDNPYSRYPISPLSKTTQKEIELQSEEIEDKRIIQES